MDTYTSQLWLASNVSRHLAPSEIRPTEASIKLTENCQARCVTCDYWKHRWPNLISRPIAVQLINRLGQLGIKTLRFTGGEPLLRRDFFDILADADTTPFSTISLQTNGLLLRDLADRVNSSPITHVTISLDAVGERNDSIRGVQGYYTRALKGMELLNGKTRIIAMTLNQVGAADLGELISHVEMFGGYLACNLPDDRLYFLRDADLTGMWPDEKTSETIVQTLQARLSSQFAPYELDYIRKYLRAGDIGRLELNPPCVLGYTTLYIASNGDVRSGCYVLSPLGNIIQQDLVAILQSPEYRARWGRPNTRVTSRHLNMSTSAADPERS
jgi:MoaA/NifB/PqqE/SkfB family radical SAM enzyme